MFQDDSPKKEKTLGKTPKAAAVTPRHKQPKVVTADVVVDSEPEPREENDEAATPKRGGGGRKAKPIAAANPTDYKDAPLLSLIVPPRNKSIKPPSPAKLLTPMKTPAKKAAAQAAAAKRSTPPPPIASTPSSGKRSRPVHNFNEEDSILNMIDEIEDDGPPPLKRQKTDKSTPRIGKKSAAASKTPSCTTTPSGAKKSVKKKQTPNKKAAPPPETPVGGRGGRKVGRKKESPEPDNDEALLPSPQPAAAATPATKKVKKTKSTPKSTPVSSEKGPVVAGKGRNEGKTTAADTIQPTSPLTKSSAKTNKKAVSKANPEPETAAASPASPKSAAKKSKKGRQKQTESLAPPTPEPALPPNKATGGRKSLKSAVPPADPPTFVEYPTPPPKSTKKSGKRGIESPLPEIQPRKNGRFSKLDTVKESPTPGGSCKKANATPAKQTAANKQNKKSPTKSAKKATPRLRKR